MPNIINELILWRQLKDTPNSYQGEAGKSPEVLPSEIGLGLAYKANRSGDPAYTFKVGEAVDPEDAVRFEQVAAAISGLLYRGTWDPNAAPVFPNETLVPANIGYYWIVSADGLDPDLNQWLIGDFAIYNGGADSALGTSWDQVAVRPPASSLPPSSVADAGKALVVNASGSATWGAPINNVGQIISGGNF